MRKSILLVSCILLLATSPVWPRKFWKEAAYSDWSEKEVMRMLNKSPWAKEMTVSLQRRQASPEPPCARAGAMAPTLQVGVSAEVEFAAAAGAVSAAAAAGVEDSAAAAWAELPPGHEPDSAMVQRLPIKQAFARARFGDQASPQPNWPNSWLRKRTTSSSVSPPAGPNDQNSARWQQAVVDRLRSETVLKVKGREPIALQAVQ